MRIRERGAQRDHIGARNQPSTSLPSSTSGWINATEIAKRFGKRPADWLKQDETREYLAALAEALTCDSESLVKTSRARADRGGGTWMHPKLGVAFARWLDLKFAVWCDLHIDARMTMIDRDAGAGKRAQPVARR